MPLHDYICQTCQHTFEKVYSLAEYEKKPVPVCPECKSFKTKKIFIPGHGGIQCDSANDVKWLKRAESVIKPDYEKPWENRSDYKRYMNEHGLIPAG